MVGQEGHFFANAANFGFKVGDEEQFLKKFHYLSGKNLILLKLILPH